MICGNKDPQVLYPQAWQYIEARFNVICLDDTQPTRPVVWPPILKTTDFKRPRDVKAANKEM